QGTVPGPPGWHSSGPLPLYESEEVHAWMRIGCRRGLDG
ncbi:hypothetical protein STIAU_0434, partial [Stigmatella aurantiaca DW4/3-1]